MIQNKEIRLAPSIYKKIENIVPRCDPCVVLYNNLLD